MRLLVITQKVDENDQLLGFFIEWLRRFAQNFDKLIVLCLEKGKYKLPANVEVLSLGKDRGSSRLCQLFTFYFSIFTLQKQYDAVFVHMNPIWMVLGGFLWKLLGKKRFLWYTSGGVTFKLKLAEKFSDVIFTASKKSFRVPSKKVIVTGHGIDTDLFRPTNNQPIQQVQGPEFIEGQPTTSGYKFKILSVGRIAPVKNYETLINAVKILKEERIDFEVTMVGEASPLKRDQYYVVRIKDKIRKFGLEGCFNFVGKINHKDLPQYYQSHDVFIHLSKTGSLDKTILEAMACGMKVLSSNDSSLAFLSNELIFKEDNPVELAEKIKVIKDRLVDPHLRNYVIHNHNLDILIDKISKYIQR